MHTKQKKKNRSQHRKEIEELEKVGRGLEDSIALEAENNMALAKKLSSKIQPPFLKAVGENMKAAEEKLKTADEEFLSFLNKLVFTAFEKAFDKPMDYPE